MLDDVRLQTPSPSSCTPAAAPENPKVSTFLEPAKHLTDHSLQGVVLTHKNLVASLGGLNTLFGHHFLPDDTYLAYLPLAHVFEYILDLFFLFKGATAGYSQPKTLLDSSLRNCKGDIAEFRPSIMNGVPAIWEMIRKDAVARISAAGAVQKNLVDWSMTFKKFNVPLISQVSDNVVLSSVRASTGGRLRWGISGGAAISRETMEFLNVTTFNLVQGEFTISLSQAHRYSYVFQVTG